MLPFEFSGILCLLVGIFTILRKDHKKNWRKKKFPLVVAFNKGSHKGGEGKGPAKNMDLSVQKFGRRKNMS